MLQKGTVIGDLYEVAGLIGRGGSGNVYACRSAGCGTLQKTKQTENRIRWAIKEAHTEQDGVPEGNDLSQRAVQSLKMEVELLKGMRHKSLVKVVDVIQGETGLLMVMEHVPGKPLDRVIRERGPLKEKEVILMGLQIADVLGYLHSRGHGIVYRDLKPSNLILRDDNQVVLVDLGAVFTTSEEFPIMKMAFGTRGYAAPEQYSETEIPDETMDVYAFGRTLTALLTGGNPRISKLRGVSGALRDILKRCTKRKKENRYANISEVYYALKNLQEKSLRGDVIQILKAALFTAAVVPAVIFTVNSLSDRGTSVIPAVVCILMSVFLWFVLQIPEELLSFTGIKSRQIVSRQRKSARVNGTFRIDEHEGSAQALSWDDIEISLDDEVTDLRIDLDNSRVQYVGMEEFVMEQDDAITRSESYKAVV